MTAVEILLVLIGIAVCVASFVIPEKKAAVSDDAVTASKEEIKELVGNEMKDAKGQMKEMVEETISYSVEKAERAMERLTNEKISAVSEFSETVLDDINKNRDEVMFLYDMLNDKHENLKETAEQITITTREANQVNEVLKEALNTQTLVETDSSEPEAAKTKETKPEEDVSEEESFTPFEELAIEKIELDENSEPEALETQTEIKFDGNDENQINHNEKILEMHRMKKSNVTIAKELGLGVGEVKLVIDLYKGM